METKYCKDCGIILEEEGKLIHGYYGEEVKKLLSRKKIWIYRCEKCAKINFCSIVNSDPRLKAKYFNIYGKTVEENLNEH